MLSKIVKMLLRICCINLSLAHGCEKIFYCFYGKAGQQDGYNSTSGDTQGSAGVVEDDAGVRPQIPDPRTIRINPKPTAPKLPTHLPKVGTVTEVRPRPQVLTVDPFLTGGLQPGLTGSPNTGSAQPQTYKIGDADISKNEVCYVYDDSVNSTDPWSAIFESNGAYKPSTTLKDWFGSNAKSAILFYDKKPKIIEKQDDGSIAFTEKHNADLDRCIAQSFGADNVQLCLALPSDAVVSLGRPCTIKLSPKSLGPVLIQNKRNFDQMENGLKFIGFTDAGTPRLFIKIPIATDNLAFSRKAKLIGPDSPISVSELFDGLRPESVNIVHNRCCSKVDGVFKDKLVQAIKLGDIDDKNAYWILNKNDTGSLLALQEADILEVTTVPHPEIERRIKACTNKVQAREEVAPPAVNLVKVNVLDDKEMLQGQQKINSNTTCYPILNAWDVRSVDVQLQAIFSYDGKRKTGIPLSQFISNTSDHCVFFNPVTTRYEVISKDQSGVLSIKESFRELRCQSLENFKSSFCRLRKNDKKILIVLPEACQIIMDNYKFKLNGGLSYNKYVDASTGGWIYADEIEQHENERLLEWDTSGKILVFYDKENGVVLKIFSDEDFKLNLVGIEAKSGIDFSNQHGLLLNGLCFDTNSGALELMNETQTGYMPHNKKLAEVISLGITTEGTIQSQQALFAHKESDGPLFASSEADIKYVEYDEKEYENIKKCFNKRGLEITEYLNPPASEASGGSSAS